MKKMLLGVLAFALALPVVHAQEKTNKEHDKVTATHERRLGKRGKHARGGYENLNLNETQKVEIDKINKDYRSAVADMKKKESTLTAKEYHTQMRALNEKRRTDADKVLTKEQKAMMQQNREGGKGKRNAEGRSERMKSDLGLTDDQSAKMKNLNAETHKKVKDIRENTELTSEQKKEQIAAAFKLQREEMKRILTPDQMRKLEEQKRSHNPKFRS